MRSHEFDAGPLAAPHVSASRELDEAQPEMVEAAIAGRTEATSSDAILGLQRAAGNASVGSLLSEEELSPVHEVVGSGNGAPLDGVTRSFMEGRLGHDFSDVRIHTGAKADESAESINALAYTVGTDVVFKSDQYAPETPNGVRMLAHELTHVVQQKSGPVDGTPAPGGLRVSDPSDRFEQAAERFARHVVDDAAPSLGPDSVTGSVASIQRAAPAEGEEKDESEEIQKLELQRLAATDEELEREEGRT